MLLAATSTLALGVNVAVQVVPPSVLARVLSVPLGAVTSALLKSWTASLKVMVSWALCPAVRLVIAAPWASWRVTTAEGALVSTL